MRRVITWESGSEVASGRLRGLLPMSYGLLLRLSCETWKPVIS